MALPNPENLAYRGITSGNARCMAYRGFICGAIIEGWRAAMTSILIVKRSLTSTLIR